MRPSFLSPLVLAVAACGSAPATPTVTATSAGTSAALVDPAALYCSGTGGSVIQRVAGGRRADLCRMPDGRIVSAADLLNSHNDL
ncbi:MAG TPA: DUF333 domain-containing protein [Paracoccus sp. (in: a-proteobacteria)]|nr:DUF333 domain-containing protein [Paracoccus sp. (in: a-proteobacteria)]